jgi:hypothetical protein
LGEPDQIERLPLAAVVADKAEILSNSYTRTAAGRISGAFPTGSHAPPLPVPEACLGREAPLTSAQAAFLTLPDQLGGELVGQG